MIRRVWQAGIVAAGVLCGPVAWAADGTRGAPADTNAAPAVTNRPSLARRLSGASPFAPAAASTSDAPVHIHARYMDFNKDTGEVVGRDHVVVERGGDRLEGDVVTLSTATHEVHALGHVVFTGEGLRWNGDELFYNFKTRAWHTGSFVAYFDPFFVRADTAETATNGVTYVLHDAYVTTCTNATPHEHYVVRVHTLHITPKQSITGRNAVFFLGNVPVMYLPWWTRPLGDSDIGFNAQAGYGSTMGAYLLTTTRYRLSPDLDANTALDYRSKRGLGVGETLAWRNGGDFGAGEFGAYYVRDRQGPEEHNAADPHPIEDNGRYRVHGQDAGLLSPRDYYLVQGTYLSDPYVEQDFFDSLYRAENQPVNFATVTHRGDQYVADVTVDKRLNDFFTGVDRLPEASVQLAPQQITGTPLFFDSQNHAGWLDKRWDSALTNNQDYSAFRIDSANMLRYPTKVDFLSLTPRAGYRATFYSSTPGTRVITDVVTSTATNTTVVGGLTQSVVQATTTTNTTTSLFDRGADLRNVVELGLETSFKAFRVYDEEENMFGRGLRHVVEPYANYTLIPKPNLTPDELWQFDAVDSVTRLQQVKAGVLNRLQTKRDGDVVSFLDLDTYTFFNLWRDGQHPLGDLYASAEFLPVNGFSLRSDVGYNTYDDRFDTIDTRLQVAFDPSWSVTLNHRLLADQNNLLGSTVSLSPNNRWTYEAYSSYEFQTSTWQEEGIAAIRHFDCMSWRFGIGYVPSYIQSDGQEHKADFRCMLQFWFTAFPSMKIGSARS